MAVSFASYIIETLSKPSLLILLGFPASGKQRDQLIARCNLSRQHAEFVGVPITDDHLDRGQHFLTTAPPLSIASLFGKQMIEQIPIRIVSHDPVPLTMLTSPSGPIVAVRWRDFWSIVLRQWIVASYHGAPVVAKGDHAIRVLGQ